MPKTGKEGRRSSRNLLRPRRVPCRLHQYPRIVPTQATLPIPPGSGNAKRTRDACTGGQVPRRPSQFLEVGLGPGSAEHPGRTSRTARGSSSPTPRAQLSSQPPADAPPQLDTARAHRSLPAAALILTDSPPPPAHKGSPRTPRFSVAAASGGQHLEAENGGEEGRGGETRRCTGCAAGLEPRARDGREDRTASLLPARARCLSRLQRKSVPAAHRTTVRCTGLASREAQPTAAETGPGASCFWPSKEPSSETPLRQQCPGRRWRLILRVINPETNERGQVKSGPSGYFFLRPRSRAVGSCPFGARDSWKKGDPRAP